MSDSGDFTKFAVGQEYEGTAIKAMPFGVFVDISEGTNVLLPRSVLSKGSYEKLKSMVENKNEEKIKVEVRTHYFESTTNLPTTNLPF
jgi:ribosomal protein S1